MSGMETSYVSIQSPIFIYTLSGVSLAPSYDVMKVSLTLKHYLIIPLTSSNPYYKTMI